VDPLPAVSFVIVAVGISAIAIGQLPELSFALSISAVMAPTGQGVAAYRQARDPRASPTQITFAWAAAGFVVGWIIVVLVELIA
jgi:hypothetical protein